jgi:hypothetical protein
MDAHAVEGLKCRGPHTRFYPVPAPYGIPYRCLYSRNIENLMFAGRNISATHMAMTSTRVIATCAVLGQAVGTAAALAVARGCSPRDLGRDHLAALQRRLMEDDCYLPGMAMEMPALTREAALSASAGEPEPLRNGVDRPVDGTGNAWHGRAGDWVAYRWDAPADLDRIRIVCDSDLNAVIRMNVWEPPIKGLPASLLRDLDVDADEGDGWQPFTVVRDNERRLIVVPVGRAVRGVRVRLKSTWGDEAIRLFAFTAH